MFTELLLALLLLALACGLIPYGSKNGHKQRLKSSIWLKLCQAKRLLRDVDAQQGKPGKGLITLPQSSPAEGHFCLLSSLVISLWWAPSMEESTSYSKGDRRSAMQ